MIKKICDMSILDYKWSHKDVLQFCRESTQGSYGKYNGAKRLEEKMFIFIREKLKENENSKI